MDECERLDCYGARHLTYESAETYTIQGGAELATNRVQPTAENIASIAENILRYKIDVLVMCGGYDGYIGVLALQKFKQEYNFH